MPCGRRVSTSPASSGIPAQDGRHRLHHLAPRPRARLVPRVDPRPARRGRARRRAARLRPSPRLVLFPPGRPSARRAEALRARARRRPDHVARSRLRSQRAVGGRPRGDADRDGPLLSQRGRAGGDHGTERRHRARCAASTTAGRASSRSWARRAAGPSRAAVRWPCPPFPSTPLDTTGAGDSFDAGFLHAWLEGRPVVDCLRWGAACGALSTRALGGTGRQADRAEVERMVGSVP